MKKCQKQHDFKALLSDHYDDILQQGVRKRIPAMGILFREGDAAGYCYLVTKGCLKLSKLNDQGREVIIRYIYSGDMTAAPAVLKKEVYPVTAQAIKPTDVIVWSKKGFVALTGQYPEIALDLLMTVFDRLEDLQTRYLELSSEQAAKRIAKLMISLMRQSGQENKSGVHIDIPLSRQNIADHIGASMYTVSRTLSSWEKSGWLKSSRKGITITDSGALALLEKTSQES